MGVVRAEVETVDLFALFREQIVHPPLDRHEFVEREFTAGDAGLVRDHDRQKAIAVDELQRLRRAGGEFHLVMVADILHLLDDHAVPIQKKRFFHN